MTDQTGRRDVLCQVVSDLAIEGDVLDELVAPLDADGWHTPTPAEGWDVAHQIAHLAWTDEVAVKAATDKEAWDAVVLDATDVYWAGRLTLCAGTGARSRPLAITMIRSDSKW
mgnify:CR=1 FL=1